MLLQSILQQIKNDLEFENESSMDSFDIYYNTICTLNSEFDFHIYILFSIRPISTKGKQPMGSATLMTGWYLL